MGFSKQLNWIILVLLLLLVGCSPRIISDSQLEQNIHCYIEIENDTIKIGEQILMNFVISNQSAKEIYVDNRPYAFYINGVKKGGFDITLKDKKGIILRPDFEGTSLRSGGYGITKIMPGKICRIRVDFPKYTNIIQGETYRVDVNKQLSVYLDRKKRPNNKMQKRISLRRLLMRRDVHRVYPLINAKDYKKVLKLSKIASTSFYVE